ncbi:uncharacterized protein AKAME5_002623200 [Lates japonicus]|uniref:Uncharacterized protein n=1 Tax=Lates japonicus TaxID=270547 RepID=A0AAD3M5W3_LATJO|nr:uncharacterized protein AKAME5_002727100 [Lates japonicus]GLD74900.1 uncharacterized protein AKAME5_002623200 [Lates japonicus]
MRESDVGEGAPPRPGGRRRRERGRRGGSGKLADGEEGEAGRADAHATLRTGQIPKSTLRGTKALLRLRLPQPRKRGGFRLMAKRPSDRRSPGRNPGPQAQGRDGTGKETLNPPPPSGGERRVGYPPARGGRPGRGRRTALRVEVPSGRRGRARVAPDVRRHRRTFSPAGADSEQRPRLQVRQPSEQAGGEVLRCQAERDAGRGRCTEVRCGPVRDEAETKRELRLRAPDRRSGRRPGASGDPGPGSQRGRAGGRGRP